MRGYVWQRLKDFEPRWRRGPASSKPTDHQQTADDSAHSGHHVRRQIGIGIGFLRRDFNDDGGLNVKSGLKLEGGELGFGRIFPTFSALLSRIHPGIIVR